MRGGQCSIEPQSIGIDILYLAAGLSSDEPVKCFSSAGRTFTQYLHVPAQNWHAKMVDVRLGHAADVDGCGVHSTTRK